jgi:DNA polymerase alpha subunit A
MTGLNPSPNIARIFGTNTTAFELLVLKRKIMGPCWLEIKNPKVENKGVSAIAALIIAALLTLSQVSWCKLEATVSDPKDINPFPDSPDAPKETPPLTVMSLSVRTIVNHQENKREVVCTTARIWHNSASILGYISSATHIHTVLIDDPKPPEQLPCTVQTFVRPLDRFPPNFEAKALANGKGAITPVKNERMLLSSLLRTL